MFPEGAILTWKQSDVHGRYFGRIFFQMHKSEIYLIQDIEGNKHFEARPHLTQNRLSMLSYFDSLLIKKLYLRN